tara:strand:+ start:64 stop:1467 length:1404 start_codon:yes stop_codon:yes gene_type:complete
MAFLIGGANTESAAYEIDNSVRLDDGSSCKLEFDTSGDGTATKGTISLWVKRSSLDEMSNGSDALIYAVNDSENYSFLRFDDDDKLDFYNITSNTLRQRFVTSRMFRDITAWYHIVLAFDVSQASSSNGVKIYVNGVLQTDFGTSTYNQNEATNFFLANANWKIGADVSDGSFFDGYLANIEAITNQQLAATAFGKFNTNGVWVPKATSHTAGTNGFKLEFKGTGTNADASGIGADTSGNGNHFTFSNLASADGDTCTDTPTNNFCTLNPIGGANSASKWVYSQGNCQVQQNDDREWRATGSTMAVSKGKWYWEIEFDAGSMTEIFVGVHDTSVSLEGVQRWVAGSTLFYNHTGGEMRQDGTDTTADYGVLTAGDILGVALNMDDDQITLYDNGSAIVTNFSLSSSITEAMPTFMADYDDVVYKVNFGNPPFSISSGNSDANGYGNFEYTVPTNYYALCTKNLAEFG